MSEVDWLSHLLQIVTVTGQLEVRCAYGAPWRVAWSRAAANEIPYHVIVKGRAIFEDPETRTARELVSGDIVLLPHGAAHVLHDGSGQTPIRTHQSVGSAGWMLERKRWPGRATRFCCAAEFFSRAAPRSADPHLPAHEPLLARTIDGLGRDGIGSAATDQLASLVGLMRMESAGDRARARRPQRPFFGPVHPGAAERRVNPTKLRRLVGAGRPSTTGASHYGDVRRSGTALETAGSGGHVRHVTRHVHAALSRQAGSLRPRSC